MFRFALLVACLAPAAAMAACPTGDDLKTGIRFATSGGDTEEFSRFTEDTVASHYYVGGVLDSRVLLARGLYLSEYLVMKDGQPDLETRSTYVFPMAPGDMPLPAPGGVFSVNITVNDAGALYGETDIYTSGQETQVRFGSCAYRMIPVEFRFEPDETNSVELLHWLPDLGLSYLAKSTSPDGNDTYSYISIEAME